MLIADITSYLLALCFTSFGQKLSRLHFLLLLFFQRLCCVSWQIKIKLMFYCFDISISSYEVFAFITNFLGLSSTAVIQQTALRILYHTALERHG